MQTTTTDSPTRRLAHQLLPGFDEYVLGLREAGESWRAIAAHIDQRTGGVLNVSHETLRRWFER